jgi:IS1 family transposase
MANVLPRARRIEVLHHLVEGNTLRSTARLTGVHRTTITDLMLDFGEHCRRLLDASLRNLTLDHLEIDEIWTFVQKKQSRLTIDERAERCDVGDIYLWSALDANTKLLASFVVGKRSADNARKLLTDLASRMVFPNSHAGDPHAFQEAKPIYITQISTDGLAAYPEAVDLAFGPYAKYGTIIKEYRNANMAYTPSEMVGTERCGRRGIEGRDLYSICTSHVERNNLTIRTLMKRFTRLSLGFSKKLENLEAAVAMFAGYYNYVWRTRKPLNSGRYRVPAAMAAGVVKELWSFEDLYDRAMAS